MPALPTVSRRNAPSAPPRSPPESTAAAPTRSPTPSRRSSRPSRTPASDPPASSPARRRPANRDAPRRDLLPRRAQPWGRQLGRHPAEVREARRETNEIDQVLRRGEALHDLLRRKARMRRDVLQVGPRLAAIAHRNLD